MVGWPAQAGRRLPPLVVLNAVEWAVAEADGAIVFTQTDAPSGHATSMAFERRVGCWFFTVQGRVLASTIEKAWAMVRGAWGGDHEGSAP